MTRWITLSLAAIAAIAVGLFVGAKLAEGPTSPTLESASALPEPKSIGDFELTDHRGERLSRRDLTGHWTFVFFGYTHCPDVCPVALSALTRMVGLLEDNAAVPVPQVLFVSVDPRRDDSEQLAQFVQYFHPDFMGATGRPQALKALTKAMGIAYNVPDAPKEQDYLVDHSASIVLMGPRARIQAYFPAPHKPQTMAADYAQIRRARGD